MNLRINDLKHPYRSLRKAAATGFSVMALLGFGVSAHANNLIVNGSFESSSSGPGQFSNNTTLAGWTSSGYNFLFASGTADTTGATGQYGNLTLWGPHDGSNNGLPASSPDGGNYVGADGAFEVGAISQTVNGLTPGAKYDVNFYWGAAQQHGFDGATTEQWKVTFGGVEQDTVVIGIPNHGFSGWRSQTFTFTASGSSALLSFLAVGTPSGVPPFALLDGVSVNASAAPEPGALSLMMGGLLCGAGLLRWKRKN